MVVLALAPLFIILLLFGVTSRFFAGWLGALSQYFLVQVLVYAFLAFYVSLIQQSIDALNGVANTKSATWATIGPVVLLAIIGILLLSQINNMAAAIAAAYRSLRDVFGRSFQRRLAIVLAYPRTGRASPSAIRSTPRRSPGGRNSRRGSGRAWDCVGDLGAVPGVSSPG